MTKSVKLFVILTFAEDSSFLASKNPTRVNEAKDVPSAEAIPKARLPILSNKIQERREKINRTTAVTTAAK